VNVGEAISLQILAHRQAIGASIGAYVVHLIDTPDFCMQRLCVQSEGHTAKFERLGALKRERTKPYSYRRNYWRYRPLC
jgi:hypothetical protein